MRTSLSFFFLPTFIDSSLLCETIACQDRLGTNRRRDVECQDRAVSHQLDYRAADDGARADEDRRGSECREVLACHHPLHRQPNRSRQVCETISFKLISRFQSCRFKTVICQDRLLRKNVNGQTFENYRFALVSTTSARCRIRRSTGTAAALPHLAIPTSPAAG